MTGDGHRIITDSRTVNLGNEWARIRFHCKDCELTGNVRAAPPTTADAFIAAAAFAHHATTSTCETEAT